MSVNTGLSTSIAKIQPPSVDAIAHSMNEYGAISVILSFVLLLLFVYFWKLINQKTASEKRFEQLEKILDNVLLSCQKVKEELIELKGLIRGSFRNQGWGDDNE